MLVNKRRKRRAARRKGVMPAGLKRYWAAKRGRSVNSKRRRRHAARAVSVRHVRRGSARRRNPRRSGGGAGGFLSVKMLKTVGFATLGALSPSLVTDRLLPAVGFGVTGYLRRAIQFAIPTILLAMGGKRVLGDGTAAFTIASYGVTGVGLACTCPGRLPGVSGSAGGLSGVSPEAVVLAYDPPPELSGGGTPRPAWPTHEPLLPLETGETTMRMLASNELARYGVGVPGLATARKGAIYDCVRVAGAATFGPGDVNFFTVPLGGLLAAGVPKTLRETNLRQAAQLPAQTSLVISEIQVMVALGTIAFPDVVTSPLAVMTFLNSFIHGASLVLNVGQRPVLELGPLAKIGAAGGLSTFGFASDTPVLAGAAGGGAISGSNGSPDGTSGYSLEPYYVRIAPNQTFGVTLNFPVAVAVAAALVTADCWVHLEGAIFSEA
jgi:hypothetical protein